MNMLKSFDSFKENKTHTLLLSDLANGIVSVWTNYHGLTPTTDEIIVNLRIMLRLMTGAKLSEARASSTPKTATRHGIMKIKIYANSTPKATRSKVVVHRVKVSASQFERKICGQVRVAVKRQRRIDESSKHLIPEQ